MKALTLLAVLLAAGCSRRFEPAAARATQANGTRCTDAASCASGVCADGFCCNRACAGTERCDAPSATGACTPRQLGDACDAGAACPTGFCADLVCCESACQGLCVACNAPPSPGICKPVAEGTDPRGACPGECTACYGESCGAAAVGSDPHAECDAGQACGVAGTCGVVDGGGCGADTDCASGHCIDGACLDWDLQQLAVETNPQATAHVVRDVASNVDGDEAVVFAEAQVSEDSTSGGDVVYEDALFIAHREATSDWQVQKIADGTPLESFPFSSAAVTYSGRTPVVLAWSPSDPACSGGRCPVRKLRAAPRGGLITLGSFFPSTGGYLTALQATTAPDGSTLAGFWDTQALEAWQTVGDDADGGWTQLGRVPTGGELAASSFFRLGEQAYFVWSSVDANQDLDGLHVDAVDGSTHLFAPIGTAGLDCASDDLMSVTTGVRGATSTTLVVCGSVATQLKWSVLRIDASSGAPSFALSALGGGTLPYSGVPFVGERSWIAAFDQAIPDVGLGWFGDDGGFRFESTFDDFSRDNFSSIASFAAARSAYDLPFVAFTTDVQGTGAAQPMYTLRYHL